MIQHKGTKDTEDQGILVKPNEASQIVIGAAMNVHTALEPGILESAYDACLFHELTKAGLHFEHQVILPIVYEGVQLSAAYRVDFIVEDCLILELKCVERSWPFIGPNCFRTFV